MNEDEIQALHVLALIPIDAIMRANLMNSIAQIETWLKPGYSKTDKQLLDKSWTARPLFNTTPMNSFD